MIENDKNIEVAYRTPLDDSFWKYIPPQFRSDLPKLTLLVL